MRVPTVTLHDDVKIPQIGLGLWQVKSRSQFDIAFTTAFAAGYRHFDTAQIYGNEEYLGDIWQRSGIKREDIFITTKIAVQNFGAKHTPRSFSQSLANLHTDYVDLLLLHFPVPLVRESAWKALEGIYKEGGARAIGVSNYTIRHLEEMEKYAGIMPMVNQVELHVFLQQPELLEYCKVHNIRVEAYSPLAHAQEMNDAAVLEIAKKHDKTYAQVMLRWCIQKDVVVLPKSVTPERIKQNIAVFDFELDNDDMTKLADRDRNLRTCWSPVHVP